MKNLVLLLAVFTAGPLYAQTAFELFPVKADAPGGLFTEEETPRLALRAEARGEALPAYEVRDHRGETVARGRWPEGEAPLTLPRLPRGYYTVTLRDRPDGPARPGGGSFGVVGVPEKRRPMSKLAYAVDTAQSWLGRPDPNNPLYPGEGFEDLSEICRRVGFNIVRERLSWADAEPSPGEFRWGDYARNARFLAERGIRISGMYHDAPGWARRPYEKLPADLAATYRFARVLAETFSGQMSVWEFWNEQDIDFSLEPAWDYAACLKAAALGFRAGDPSLPVALGGIAITPLRSNNALVMDNGAADYFDILNVHTYRQIGEYDAMLDEIRRFREKYDIADKPVWFTEIGPNIEGSARLPGPIPGLRMHDPDQEALVAEYLPKALIRLQSLGVERSFWFVLPPKNEQSGQKDWGLLRRDYSAKPALVAFAALIDRLGDASYGGELALGEGMRGYLYQHPDGTQTLAYWLISDTEGAHRRPDLRFDDRERRAFRLALPDGEYSLTDGYGRTDEVGAKDGALALEAGRMPRYLSGPRGLVADRPAEDPVRPRAPGAAPRRRDREECILLRTGKIVDFELNALKDALYLKKEAGDIPLEVWNLSDAPRRGTLAVDGAALEGMPSGEIEVPAWGKTALSLRFRGDPERADPLVRLTFSGEFGGKPIDPMVMQVIEFARLGDALRQVPLPEASDPARWEHNSAGKLDIRYLPEEDAVRFHTVFPAGVDRWSYPVFRLQLPQESLRGACGIAFELRSPDGPEACMMMQLMAVEGTDRERGMGTKLPVEKPLREWKEQWVLFPEGGFDADKLRLLRLGMNGLRPEATWDIRRVRVLYRR